MLVHPLACEVCLREANLKFIRCHTEDVKDHSKRSKLVIFLSSHLSVLTNMPADPGKLNKGQRNQPQDGRE